VTKEGKMYLEGKKIFPERSIPRDVTVLSKKAAKGKKFGHTMHFSNNSSRKVWKNLEIAGKKVIFAADISNNHLPCEHCVRSNTLSLRQKN